MLRGPDGREEKLAEFSTDEQGGGNPRFDLPDWADGDYQLRGALMKTVIGHVIEAARAQGVELEANFTAVRLSIGAAVLEAGQLS